MDGLVVSKRGLLKGAGALAAVCISASMRAAWAADTWDVIVIGGGTAGLPTAIFAAARGLRVLVVEKSGFLGGTLDRSGGQIAAAGTKFQKAKGIKDTVQQHYDDIMRICNNTADAALVRLFVDNATATICAVAGASGERRRARSLQRAALSLGSRGRAQHSEGAASDHRQGDRRRKGHDVVAHGRGGTSPR